MHGPFNELTPAAIDPLVLEITEKRYRQAIEKAAKLRIPKLVLHAGFVPLVYYPEWFVSRSVLVWKRLIRDVPEHLTVCLENVMEPDASMLLGIVRQVNDARLREHVRQPGNACGLAQSLCALSFSCSLTQQRRYP